MSLYDDLNHYEVGDLVRVAVVFTDQITGLPFDPTALSLTYKAPNGTATVLTFGVDVALVKDSTGNYHTDVNASAAGIWPWRCASTGSGQAAVEGRFYVKPTLV